VLVDAQDAWNMRDPTVQVREQRVHRGRPWPGCPVHGRPDPPDTTDVAG
jgi:hypothetical protein